MQPLPLSESVRLPVDRAVGRHLDDRNWLMLRWLLACFLLGALIGTIASLEAGVYLAAAAWGIDFLVVLSLILVRRARFFERYFRELLIGYLVLQFAVLLLVSTEAGFSYALAGFLLPFVLLFFRLRRIELAGILAIALGVAIWYGLSPGSEAEASWEAKLGMILGASSASLVAFFLGNRLTKRRTNNFLAQWHIEHGRAREQARMREELDDARQIQLSMLPHDAPNLSWLDLASASLPATEVGGDYFDYVPLDPQRLAIVVGDVAGHGVASGLVLAAIRGGLHLLKNELSQPSEALRRLDSMVQEIAPGRMYVTLEIAILDHRLARLTVVSAGHPPVLHYQASSGAVTEVGGPAIPLGTRLETRLTEHTADLSAGDVLLFYSDGVPEAADLHGELFGHQRLAEAVKRSATGLSAAEVRTSILDSVNRFKGDVELIDDLTVVVAKLSG